MNHKPKLRKKPVRRPAKRKQKYGPCVPAASSITLTPGKWLVCGLMVPRRLRSVDE